MRRINAILGMSALLLFILHGVLGSFQMLGIGSIMMKPLIVLMMICLVLHIIFGTILTIQTLFAWKKSGKAYFKENLLFWIRRISGFAIMFLIYFHVTAFAKTENGITRLEWFDGFKLLVNFMMVLVTAIHVLTNIKPLMLALGTKKIKNFIWQILLTLSVLIFFMAVSFVVYYWIWNIM